MPRAVGRALIRSKARGGNSCIDTLKLSGSCRMLFPRQTTPALDAVLLNTSGGITGGDRFVTDAEAGSDSHLALTTQAAERAYRSVDGRPGHVTNTLTAEDSAVLEWLPQETILFDGSSLDRSLKADLGTSSRFLMVEPVIFGRTAMGESVRNATLRDKIEIRRDGRLVFADSVHLSGDLQDHLSGPAVAGGARAMASLLLVAADADTWLKQTRNLLPETCGVSLVRDGVLFARFLASDGHALRQSLVPVLKHLRGQDLPKTWML